MTTSQVTATGITVTANPDATPPRFEVELATPDSSVMTAVTLTRTISGVPVATRVQPNAGSSFGYVEDYEEPWGVDVVYSAQVVTASGTATYTAPPIQLNPAAAWAIHPSVPAASVCIDQQSTDVMGVVSIDAVTRPSQATQHQILGAARPITTRVGPRASTRGTLQVQTVSLFEETLLWNLVDDQTPLVIQFPTTWGTGWEYGYYDIGDVSVSRVLQWSGDVRRVFALPFTSVDRPAGSQASTWDYPTLLNDFADYPAVAAAFTDYRALLANDRS